MFDMDSTLDQRKRLCKPEDAGGWIWFNNVQKLYCGMVLILN